MVVRSTTRFLSMTRHLCFLLPLVLSACGQHSDSNENASTKPQIQFKVDASNSNICWFGIRNSGKSIDLYLSRLNVDTAARFNSLDIAANSEDAKDLNLKQAMNILLASNLDGKCNVYVPSCEVETGSSESNPDGSTKSWTALNIGRYESGSQDSYFHLVAPRDGTQQENVAVLNVRKAKLQAMGACR